MSRQTLSDGKEIRLELPALRTIREDGEAIIESDRNGEYRLFLDARRITVTEAGQRGANTDELEEAAWNGETSHPDITAFSVEDKTENPTYRKLPFPLPLSELKT